MVAQSTIILSSGVEMPLIGFGTNKISNGECKETIQTALDAGYRHIDTAESYQNEQGIGAAIHQSIHSGKVTRDELFLTTKLWPGNIQWGQQPKTTKTTVSALDQSLMRLQVGYVDLYLIHAPMAKKERLAQWKGLLELQQQGKARTIGVSNFSWRHIEEIKAAGLPLPALNQIELNPWVQRPALVNYLRDQGVTPMAYSSLLPLSACRDAKKQGSAKSEKMTTDGMHQTSPLKRIAKKYGVYESQLLLRWGIQRGYPVIPKSINPEHMRQNLELFNFNIDQVDMVIINAMSRGFGFARAKNEPSKRLKIHSTA